MAIQVGGTTVIDDSRDLQNVGGLKTVGGTSILGSGNIAVGDSTTYDAVGTYAYCYWNTNWEEARAGNTASGSYIKLVGTTATSTTFGPAQSGTWRWMAHGTDSGSNQNNIGIAVRIS